MTALALIVGRPIAEDDYPARIGEMAAGTWALSATGGIEPLPAALREWLMRAIQLDPRNPFPSALEAWAELDRVLHYSDPIAEIAALKTFLTRYQARVAADSAKTAGPTAMPHMAARPAAPSAPSAMPASAAVASVTPQSGPQAVAHPRPVAVPGPDSRRSFVGFPGRVLCTPRHPHALTLRSLPRSSRRRPTIRRPSTAGPRRPRASWRRAIR